MYLDTLALRERFLAKRDIRFGRTPREDDENPRRRQRLNTPPLPTSEVIEVFDTPPPPPPAPRVSPEVIEVFDSPVDFPLAAAADRSSPLAAAADRSSPLAAVADRSSPLAAAAARSSPLAAAAARSSPLAAAAARSSPLGAGGEESVDEGYLQYFSAEGRAPLPPLMRVRRDEVDPSQIDRFVPNVESFGERFLKFGRYDITFEQQAALAWPLQADEIEGPDDAMKIRHLEERNRIISDMYKNMLMTWNAVDDQLDELHLTNRSTGRPNYIIRYIDNGDGKRGVVGSGTYGIAKLCELVDTSSEEPPRRCVVKFVRVENSVRNIRMFLNEIIIHTILVGIQNSNANIREQQNASKMAKIPMIYRAGHVKAYRHDVGGGGGGGGGGGAGAGAGAAGRMSRYFFVVMEELGPDVYKLWRKVGINANDRAAVSSMIMYQTANALEHFGRICGFNHFDLKPTNILVKADNSVRTRFCGFPDFFTTYIIDFGFSRVKFKNRVVSASPDLVGYDRVTTYRPHADIQFLSWYMYHGMAYIAMRRAADRYVDARSRGVFEEFFESMMNRITNAAGTSDASGRYQVYPYPFDFDMDDYINFIDAIPRTGHASLRGVRVLMKAYLRYIASLCNRRPDVNEHREFLRQQIQRSVPGPTTVNDRQDGVYTQNDLNPAHPIVEYFNP